MWKWGSGGHWSFCVEVQLYNDHLWYGYNNYNSVISDGSYETRNMSVPARRMLLPRAACNMACERALVILLVSLCSSWNPRAEAADGEDGWVVNRCCIALLPVRPLVAPMAYIDAFGGARRGRWCGGGGRGGILSIHHAVLLYMYGS